MKLILVIFGILFAFSAFGQIKLVMMETAAGADTIIVTDADGRQTYKPISYLNDLILSVDSVFTKTDSLCYVVNGDTSCFYLEPNSDGQLLSIDSTGRIFEISISNGNSVKFEDRDQVDYFSEDWFNVESNIGGYKWWMPDSTIWGTHYYIDSTERNAEPGIGMVDAPIPFTGSYDLNVDTALMATQWYANSLVDTVNIYTDNGTLTGDRTVSMAGNDLTFDDATGGSVFTFDGRVEQTGLGNSTFFGDGAGQNDDGTANYNVGIGYQSLYSNTSGYNNMALGSGALYTNISGYHNVGIGTWALHYSTSNYNTGVGSGAMAFTTTGAGNVSIGSNSLYNNTTGGYNVAIGFNALKLQQTQSYNVGIGYNTGYNNSGTSITAIGSYVLDAGNSGANNVGIGYQVLTDNTSGANNTGIGTKSLFKNTTGSLNTANGSYSLYANTTGSNNTANGFYSLYANKANSRSTAIGYNAMYYADDRTTGRSTYNTAIGHEALRGSPTAADNTGQYNTAIGDGSMYSNTTGSFNTANGYKTLYSNTTGSNNTAIGYQAGDNISTGSNNIIIGNIDAPSATGSNQFALGNGSDYLISGDISGGTVTFNSAYTFPSADGTDGQVLTSDGAGTLAFEDVPASTDNQTVDTLSLSGTTLTLALERDNEAPYTVDLSSLQDGTGTDDQTLSIDSTGRVFELSIEDGNSVKFEDLDEQDLSLSGNTLSLSNDATTVDLSGYLDNTDTQDLSIDSTGRVFTIALADGGFVNFLDTDTNTQLSEEEVEDYVGGMLTGNTETGITVTYQDGDGTIDFVATDASTTNELQTLTGDVSSTGTTTLTTTIGANKVLESHLKAVNSPTDEYYLTYEATTGDFEWQTATVTEAQTLDDVTDLGATTTNAITTGDHTLTDATPFIEWDGGGTDWVAAYNNTENFYFYPQADDSNGFQIKTYTQEDRLQFIPHTTESTKIRMYDTGETERVELTASTSGVTLEISGDNGDANQVLTSDGTYMSWEDVPATTMSTARYYKSSAQSVTNSWANVQFGTELFDPESEYSLVSYEIFTSGAGYYEVTFSADVVDPGDNTDEMVEFKWYINEVDPTGYSQQTVHVPRAGAQHITMTDIFYLTSSTEEIEVLVQSADASATSQISANASLTIKKIQ